jgi:hypothetical protein|tara:strand:- start:65 stop:211 length:147 start_codon:yes stop_codon:yes gene_type:complete
MAVKKKKKVAVAIIQFTFSGELYKIGDSFKGSKIQQDSLINKNLIKWQ